MLVEEFVSLFHFDIEKSDWIKKMSQRLNTKMHFDWRSLTFKRCFNRLILAILLVQTQ
jgi:hypothetical protein